MVEQVDTRDLKSLDIQPSCRFKSGSRQPPNKGDFFLPGQISEKTAGAKKKNGIQKNPVFFISLG